MLHDYRKPYNKRRIEPLSQWLITAPFNAYEQKKSVRATCLGIARRGGKPVRLWSFQIHNHRGQPRKFLEYFETPISVDDDEISAVLARGRQLDGRREK